MGDSNCYHQAKAVTLKGGTRTLQAPKEMEIGKERGEIRISHRNKNNEYSTKTIKYQINTIYIGLKGLPVVVKVLYKFY